MHPIVTPAQAPGQERAELERIRAEYERRSREIPAGRYGWQHPVQQFWYFHLYRAVLKGLQRSAMFPLDERRILDIGCGGGLWLTAFLSWGASAQQLSGIDLNEQRIEAARRRLPGLDLHCGDAAQLPWPEAEFDVVSQFVAFSSMLDPAMRQRVANEMRRVLKPGGVILWHDFFVNNPANPNVRGVRAAEVRSLFSGCRVELQKITLAPPIARLITPVCWSAASLLNCFPFLRTHYFATICPGKGS